MALDDDIRILERVKLLDGFSQEQLRLLAFGAENMRLRAGRELYQEGAEADCAFIVSTRTVELFRNRDGARITVATAGPGTILGEFALIAGGTRHTGAAAQTDIEVIRLNRSLFRRILEEYPDLAGALRQRIIADMRNFLSRIEQLGTRFKD